MSFLDKAKEAAEQAVEKAKEAASTAAHRIEETGAVDKAASFVDEKTGGKYSDKIAKAADSAKDGVSKLKADGTEDEAVDVEYSTQFGTEPTESAKDAAEVFKEHPEV